MTAGGRHGVPVMAAPAPVATPVATPAGPAVTFGEGRRPESRTQVQLAEFDGPLALLLSLIEARQLDVLTVPLGALADAYLDALGRLEADRLGNVSAFVTIASQLILIKSRAMLPRRTDPTDPTALADEGTDPEAELRARLIIYRAHRDAGLRLAEAAVRRIGLFRREPGVARAAGARRCACRRTRRPSTRSASSGRSTGWPSIAPPPEPPPEVARPDHHASPSEPRSSGRLCVERRRVVLQELLEGVRDRVVIAVTFLAMLELMKRREIVVEQAEPWGPIVARVHDGRGARRGGRRRDRHRCAARRVAGVVRVSEANEPTDDGTTPARAADDDGRAPPIELTEAALEALLFVAENAAVAARDRGRSPAPTGRPWTPGSATSRCRCGPAGIRLLIDGDRVELATAPEGGALVARYVGADAVRLSPASLETLAIVAYRQPVTKSAVERIRGVDSDYTIRTLLHRRLVVELGRSDAPGRPFLYGTGFEFLERFGLTSLDELPPLDVGRRGAPRRGGRRAAHRTALPDGRGGRGTGPRRCARVQRAPGPGEATD